MDNSKDRERSLPHQNAPSVVSLAPTEANAAQRIRNERTSRRLTPESTSTNFHASIEELRQIGNYIFYCDGGRRSTDT